MSILALGKQKKREKKRKIPNQRVGESKKKERKFPIKDQKKTKETSRKVFGPDNVMNNSHFNAPERKKKKVSENLPPILRLKGALPKESH